MNIYCLINDDMGRAVAGTAELPDAVFARARRLENVDKTPNEPKEPHHPQKPTMIRVGRGSHTIITISATNPQQEFKLPLQAGDGLLFLDFMPPVKPPSHAANGEELHHYTGHHSVVGPQGAVLERWEWDEPIDPAGLNWQPAA